jgi:general secretion pathway protein B
MDNAGPVAAAISVPPSGRTTDQPADRARGTHAAIPAPPAVKAGGEIGVVEPKPSQEKTKAAPSNAKPQAVQADGDGAEPEPLQDKNSETEKAVPPLRDLPVDIQREMPELSFSMLVFSKNPADRRIGINGKLKHEGDEVAADLKVERITPTGAVLSFRGHRFHKDVL